MRACARRLAVLALLLGLAGAGLAQPTGEVRVGTREGQPLVKLDMPPFVGDPAAGDQVRGVVRDDLHFSGLFEIPEGAPTPYRLTGAVETVEGKHVVTVSLQETEAGQAPLFSKRFRGGADSLRRIAHRIADEVVRAFTGQVGSFDTRIAFVSDRGEGRDVYLMDYDGASVSRVTKDRALVLSPEVSPDGKLLLFTSYASGVPAVFLVKRESGEMKRLFPKRDLNQSPAFSPDGSELAFSATFEGNSEIYVSDLSGGRLRRLTQHPSIDVSPAWTPTGREIVFVSDRSGGPQLHVMTAEGLDVRRLTTAGNYNSEPAVSPDGATIAFSSRQAGHFHLALLDRATNAVTALTSGPHDDESPCWSPNGEYIAFASNRDGGKYDIWIVRRDGDQPRRVGSRGENRHPFWYR
jgi:TolB protein